MKNLLIGIAIAVLLIGAVAGAKILYDNLSDDYGTVGGFTEFVPSGDGNLPQSKPEQTAQSNTDETEKGYASETAEKSETVEKSETAENAEVTENTEESKTAENMEVTENTEESKTAGNTEVTENTENSETAENAEVTENTENSETAENTEVTENTEESETTENIETTETTEKSETTEKEEPVIIFSAPDFTVLDYDGNEVKLSDFAGKPIVLNFWATWCGYCKIEMPDFNQAYKDFPNVQFLMVNATDGVSETVASAKKYVEAQGFEFKVVFDTKLDALNTYGVSGFPTTFFISADGSKIYYISGAIDYETIVSGIELIK